MDLKIIEKYPADPDGRHCLIPLVKGDAFMFGREEEPVNWETVIVVIDRKVADVFMCENAYETISVLRSNGHEQSDEKIRSFAYQHLKSLFNEALDSAPSPIV